MRRFAQWLGSLFQRRCPECKTKGSLVWRNTIKATMVSADGSRLPAAWAYYDCSECESVFKIDTRGRISSPTKSEWLRYVVEAEPTAPDEP